MEPIAEEKSELAMEIAQAVVEKLDIDRKLDLRMREVMQRGDRIFRDIQVRQEQSVEALCRSVGMCLESQRAFHEEHQKLLGAVKSLASMVAPYSPYGLQAVEAHARAAALAEETEVWKKQMEAQANPAAVVGATNPVPVVPPSPTAQTPAGTGGHIFNITLRKADDTSLGLSVTANEDNQVLLVEGVVPGGAVESWNRQCFGDPSGERVVVAGDRIVCVNGIQNDVEKMLKECSTQRLVKLVIARGPARTSAVDPALQKTNNKSNMEAAETENGQKFVSNLRTKAPEFVPMGTAPLQPTQPLAAPPGLFLRNDDESSGNTIQTGNKKVAAAEPMHLQAMAAQDCGAEDDDADKENSQ
jgi:hypothetical protein